jgi:hypothetical protein
MPVPESHSPSSDRPGSKPLPIADRDEARGGDPSTSRWVRESPSRSASPRGRPADPERSAGALRYARAWRAWDAVPSGRRAIAPWWRDTPGRHRAWPRCGEPHARSWTAPGPSGGRPRGCRAPVRAEARSPPDRRTTGSVRTGAGTKGRGGRVACRPPDGTSGFLEPAPRRCQRLHPRWSDLLRWRPRTGEERHVLQPKAGLASAMGLAPTGPNVASAFSSPPLLQGVATIT